jgi:hypothetical protein
MINSILPVRPESELLTICARTEGDDRSAERLSVLLRRGVDWELVVKAAFLNGVTPLVERSLRTIQQVPDPIRSRLEGSVQENTRRNLLMTAELMELLKRFRSDGLMAVPFKGPVLAASLYGDVALRQFMDLDIVVRGADVQAALALMIEEGYEPWFRFSEAEQRRFVRYQNEYSLLRRDDSVLVELQWSVAPRYFAAPLDLDVMFERLDPFRLGGQEVPTFSLEDLFLMLCIHGAKHLWGRLAWVCDLHELGKRHDISWEQLTARASSAGALRMVLLGVLLSRDLLGSELPATMARSIEEDRDVRAVGLEIERTLVGSRRRPLTASEMQRLQLRLRLGTIERLRYVARLGLTPTVGDWEFVSLPPRLAPLYYIIRPVRLLRQRAERSQRAT